MAAAAARATVRPNRRCRPSASDMLRRRLTQLGMMAATAAAAWLVASNGVAAAFNAQGDSAMAARLAPDADRLSRSAEASLQRRDFAVAAALARRALAISPLQTRAARVLGMAVLAMHRPAQGLAALDVAARGGWRDTPTQLWLLQAALDTGDYDSALQRGDALIRRDTATDAVFALFRQMDGEPAFRRSLLRRLGDTPDWRGLMFLDFRRAAAGELAGLDRLIAETARTPHPATDLELFPLVERMLELGMTAPAYALWRSKAPPAGWSAGNLLYDGRFAVANARQGAATPPRFEWWIDPDGTGQASVGPAPNGRGFALTATSRTGDTTTLAAQALALAPGSYRIAARLFAHDARDWSGFEFAVRCAPQNQETPLLESRVRQLRLDQLGYGSRFAIPAGCTRQDLMLRTTGGSGSASVAIGEIAIQAIG